jgi:Golgi nucleoside diphosphatase
LQNISYTPTFEVLSVYHFSYFLVCKHCHPTATATLKKENFMKNVEELMQHSYVMLYSHHQLTPSANKSQKKEIP